MPKELRAVSLFSGCGGFCEGIGLAGFKILTSVEFDRFAAETYRANFPGVRLYDKDVRGFLRAGDDSENWLSELEGVDLLFGGPPCQGFSQIGTRDLEDERNTLYLDFVRVLKKLRPRAFLIENVPNLLLLNKGHFRDLILRSLQRAGYSNANVITVLASDFGVPQTRRRAVFFGVRDDCEFPVDLPEFFASALALQKRSVASTVRDAIGDLPARVVESGETIPYPQTAEPTRFQRLMRLDRNTSLYSTRRKKANLPGGRTLLYNHHTKEIQERRLELIKHLKPGLKANSLPKEYWDGLRPEKWRRLHPDLPSHTVLAQMHRDLSEFVHPWLDRWITVREAARLQSFHDGFVFHGSEWQQLKQIGNAVPPLLAHALGSAMAEVLSALDGRVSRRRGRGREIQGVLALHQ